VSLSTHVLDTSRGEPLAGVPVRLECCERDRWMPVAFGRTDADGRLAGWVPATGWHKGRYRLIFRTESEFFPEVVVVFEVADPDRHLHVPLLLSPYGYTTYRGS
jgi:5-hydroxyisourate hydrolase